VAARRVATGASEPVTIIVNTGDDAWISGLRVCPDLDSVMYALAGVVDEDRGWGRAGETHRVADELASYDVGWPWFALGDLDIATHIARTSMLRDGLRLTETTEKLCARWNDGDGLPARVLPVSDDPVETHVEVDLDGNARLLHFQEWWVRHHAVPPARRFVQTGLEAARATPEVVDTVARASAILVAPSNPVVSIGTILAVPGIREALAASGAPVVGVSPIIGNEPVRGMAAECLEAVGARVSAAGVAELLGAAVSGGLLDGWLIAEEDADQVEEVERLGIACRSIPLWMRNLTTTTTMAEEALDLAASLD
jgi:LPPG:FO 2-phospho-L-lactate transferase